mmetsp:Transcript_62518/g.152205  ORF Transcript_62518/g.152205 Transcript_62518/m.152205 type:complete len:91 (-) Transcript_62518:490-762(-)
MCWRLVHLVSKILIESWRISCEQHPNDRDSRAWCLSPIEWTTLGPTRTQPDKLRWRNVVGQRFKYSTTKSSSNRAQLVRSRDTSGIVDNP